MNRARVNNAKRLASSASIYPNIYSAKVKEKLQQESDAICFLEDMPETTYYF